MFKKTESTNLPSRSPSTTPSVVKTTQTTAKSTHRSTESTNLPSRSPSTTPSVVKTIQTTAKSTQRSTASTKKAATSQKSSFTSPTTPFLSKPFDLTKPTEGQTKSTISSIPRSGSPFDAQSAGTKSTTPSKIDVSGRNRGQYETTPSTRQVPEVESTSSTTHSPFISYKKIRYETFDQLDGVPSKIPDPVPAETKRSILEMTNDFMIEQTILESQAFKEGIRARTQERQMRYGMKKSKIEELQRHPFFQRMMRSVVDQWLKEKKNAKRYKGHERYKDTVVSRGRIQPHLCHHILEYAIRFNKLPWVHPGKNRIHTKIYDRVDFVDKPFVITEEKTEKEVKRQTVKTVKSARRHSW